MGALKIIECAICGKLLQSHGQKICAQCAEQTDKDILAVRDYINGTPEGVGINDILNNTGVSEKMVLYLMKEGRLSQYSNLREGSLKCAACAAPISKGKLCSKCSAVWSNASGSRTTQSQTDEEPLKKGERMYYNRNS